IRGETGRGGWVYRVGDGVAGGGKVQTTVRRQREQQIPPPPPGDALAEITARELLTALDAEIQQLPDRYRTPLVLCSLQGLTCDEAARQMDCSDRTVKRRLEEARRRVGGGLARRGLALSGPLVLAGLAQAEAVPAPLVAGAVQTALHVPAAAPAALAKGVLAGIGAVRAKLTAVLLLTLVLAGAGLGA